MTQSNKFISESEITNALQARKLPTDFSHRRAFEAGVRHSKKNNTFSRYKQAQPVYAYHQGRYRKAIFAFPFDDEKSAVNVFMPADVEISERWESVNIQNELIEPDYLRSLIFHIKNYFQK